MRGPTTFAIPISTIIPIFPNTIMPIATLLLFTIVVVVVVVMVVVMVVTVEPHGCLRPHVGRHGAVQTGVRHRGEVTTQHTSRK